MILVLGCGLTGVSVANYLHQKNIDFCLADSRKNPPLAKKLPKCNTHFGGWDKQILTNITQIIISPGLDPNEQIVKWAIVKKIPIINDLDLFYQLNSSKKLIGITGSNGKSTTTKLTEFVLQKMGLKAIAMGNIGIPVLEADNFDIAILELSSYQLDYSNLLQLDFGLILNITPDHLDRYKSFANYKKSKLKIHQISKTILTDNFVNSVPNKNQFGVLTCHNSQYVIFNDEVVLDYDKCQLLGTHNLENILATLSICHNLGLDLKKATEQIYKFKGLEHRLEFVKTIDNTSFYNDSKATNSTSTISAINAIGSKYNDITLILGGVKKDEDYQDLFDLIAKKVKRVILIGESSTFFASKIKNPILVKSLKQAINFAKNSECVLFSPACASFDMFENFEKRGLEFKKLLKNYE